MLLVLFKGDSYLDTHFRQLVACMTLPTPTRYTYHKISDFPDPL
jgi:hypothetical protein